MADEKHLPSEQEKRNQLKNSGSNANNLISSAFASLDEQALKEIGKKAADEALRLESKQREQMLDREAASRDVNQHVDAWNMLEEKGKFTRQKITTDVKTGAGNMRIESKSGGACFVATAVYENECHPDVIFLRRFRDGFLSRYSMGKAFISWYYINGPKLALKIKKSNRLKVFTRSCLKCLVVLMKKIPFNL